MPHLQGFLEAIPNAALLVDRHGVIQYSNRYVASVLGYDQEALDGMLVENLLREEDRLHHVEYRDEYMVDPQPRPMGRERDLYALHRDGQEIPVEISLGPVREADDLFVLVTIADITIRKHRAQELERQNERLDKFTRMVSHDLRNPLTVAAGRLDLARETADNEHLEMAAQALAHMDTLVQDTLSIALAGRTVGEKTPIELASFAEQCWQTIDTESVRLVVDTDATVHADKTRFQQLLANLFANAIKHGGTVSEVRVYDTDTGFVVEDDGDGIPIDARDDIFEPGYTTNADGTGLGLSIVKEIVDAHGWRIQLDERTTGGARFAVSNVDIVAQNAVN